MSFPEPMGSIIKLKDGRVGTIVYNGLDGQGIVWGEHKVSKADFEGTTGGLFDREPPEGFNKDLIAVAMLRKPYPGADPDMEYVGEDYEVVEPIE